MIIGVISDTHDALPVLEIAFNAFRARRTDLIVHCGDWKSPDSVARFASLARQHDLKWKGVIGNNDHEVAAFEQLGVHNGVLQLELDDLQAAAYHGHHRPTLNRLLRNEAGNDVLFLGHSHKPRNEVVDGLHIVNPGSTAFAIPRSRTWQPTIAFYDSSTRQAEIVPLL